jgi:ribosomal protein L29
VSDAELIHELELKLERTLRELAELELGHAHPAERLLKRAEVIEVRREIARAAGVLRRRRHERSAA